MAFAVVAHTSAASSDGTTVTTGAIDTTGATLLVVGAGAGTSIGSIADSKSNSWTAGAAVTNTLITQIWHVINPTSVGSGHTFTVNTQASSFPAICVLALSGADTAASRDQQNTGTAAAGTTVQPGSVTPTADNEIVITAAHVTVTGETVSIDGGFNISDQVTAGGPNYGVALAYLIQTSLAAANPTWTFSTTETFPAAGIDTFKAAAGVTVPQEVPATQAWVVDFGPRYV